MSQNFQWSERKRKRSKRYLSSDDDLVVETDSLSVADYPRRQDSLVANSDIDVVGEEEHEQDDQCSNHTINKPTKSKAKVAVGHGPPARKKSRKVVTSDFETDNEYLDVVGDSGNEFEDENENENDYLPTDPKPTAKGPKAKGKASATTSIKGGAKRRAKVDNTSEVPVANKKRPKLTPRADEASLDVVGDSSSTPNVSIAGDRSIHTISKHDSPPPPTPALPKKPKLPTIKKVKLPNISTSTSSSTVVIDTAPVLPPLGGKPVQDGVRKTLNGTIDIDLSNKSIYEEIFSKTVCIAIVFFCLYLVHVSVGPRRWRDATGWGQQTDQGGRKTERVEPAKR